MTALDQAQKKVDDAEKASLEAYDFYVKAAELAGQAREELKNLLFKSSNLFVLPNPGTPLHDRWKQFLTKHKEQSI